MDIFFEDWGTIDYKMALERQQTLFDHALENKSKAKPVENRVIFCEHPPVITSGKHAKRENILFSDENLQQMNVPTVQTMRGGDVTCHVPGQLVVYPILDLTVFGLGLKRYIAVLEDTVITLLQEIYNITAGRMPHAAGVWIDAEQPSGARKICALGIYCSRFITMHGLALNVNADLSLFSLINPCGFTDKGVTSIERETGQLQDINLCKMFLKEMFANKLRIT
ncbi:MAG: lipoyl(octanoyl) transferase LipB [Bacteroidales bacterium]|jgi:lipoyl(octanoyl) transferase|nr:lipoyl(octanoyl) transferase LipB [Bacteroidales bacterium]